MDLSTGWHPGYLAKLARNIAKPGVSSLVVFICVLIGSSLFGRATS
jgi:hypothetical protein